jgi:hypothetical protein
MRALAALVITVLIALLFDQFTFPFALGVIGGMAITLAWGADLGARHQAKASEIANGIETETYA